MNAANCPFCQQIGRLERLSPDLLVWQFPHSVALLGNFQFYHGYCILVSRTHAREPFLLPDDERRGYFDDLCLLARATQAAFQPVKLNYELLGNQVEHLHWHLFPRHADDTEPKQPVWLALNRAERDAAEKARLTNGPVSRAETAERLRQELRKLAAAG